MRPPEYLAILSNRYPYLNAADLNLLVGILRVSRLRKKDIFISPGESRPRVAFIAEGMVRGYFINEHGEEKTVFLSREGLFVGAPEAAFSRSPTKYYFAAESESMLLTFDFESLKELGYSHPNIGRLVSDSLSEIIMILIQRLESLIDRSPESRYDKLIDEQPQFFQKAFHKHLANYLGISAVSLSRIIKRKSRKR